VRLRGNHEERITRLEIVAWVEAKTAK